ncbi:MAG: sugar porter family MFS transporter [Acidobacteria bacterium]|nr:sugar porter family MFS transporter [Acidobacteriota bacterium]
MELVQMGESAGLRMKGSLAYTLSISTVAALGAVMFGFDIAIISGAVPFVQQNFGLTELQLGWGVSSLIIGSMLGALAAGRAADRFGRKRTLLWIALVFAVSSVFTAIAPTFTTFFLARILGGLAVGAASMISPLYIAEVAPSQVRGGLVTLSQLGITVGCLVSYLINYLLRNIGPNNWRWMFATGALPSVAFFVLLFFVPESPRWLFLAGKREKAREILARVGGVENADRELAAMHEVKDERVGTLSDLLHPRYRRVLIVGALLAMLVQMSGINTVIAYSPIILRSVGNGLDTAFLQTFLIGLVNFLATFIAILCVDKFGRRPLYMIGSTGMAISLLLLSVGYRTGHLSGWSGFVLVLVFIASFAGCIGPVYWILMAEMFPTKIRGMAMSAAVFLCWLFNFVVVLLFPWFMKNLGGSVTFLLLAVMSIAMFVVAWKLVPETTGQTLEQIEEKWGIGLE